MSEAADEFSRQCQAGWLTWTSGSSDAIGNELGLGTLQQQQQQMLFPAFSQMPYMPSAEEMARVAAFQAQACDLGYQRQVDEMRRRTHMAGWSQHYLDALLDVELGLHLGNELDG